ncbi:MULTISPECIES: hypothetical protein [Actinomadura]|uniref:hypothetical protein n=1 Tax=Actinomadura TaxID=1988 RepID=UPI001267E19E|nr:hypothetical protein [Actinomadura madurae]
MRIPKRVNAVLDWMEQHFLALAIVVALVVVALVALLAPTAVGFPVAGFVLGAAAGGLLVHVRLSRRIARARADVDNLLRENGALRHRNTVLASGVITREAQETQALVAIPEDDLLLDEPDADPQKTATLDELLDGGDDPQTTDELPDQDAAPETEEPEAVEPKGEKPEGEKSEAKELGDGDPQRTTVLPTLPGLLGGGEEEEDTVRTRRRTRKA